MAYDFMGAVCVVTGASSGIGRQTALDLAADGARVCVAARREERLAALVDEMGGTARGHSFHVTDVSDRDQVRALARHVEDTYGRCDVLVNNAGVPSHHSFKGAESLDELHRVMGINFFGPANCVAELLPLLERSKPAHVVNVASMAARVAIPQLSSYCASKSALAAWSESLHYELSKREVYVTSVEPGFIPTEGFPQKNMVRDPMLSKLLGTSEDVSKAIRDAVAARKPQRVVPRWYYLAQVPRVVAPGAFRLGMCKLLSSPAGRKARDFM